MRELQRLAAAATVALCALIAPVAAEGLDCDQKNSAALDSAPQRQGDLNTNYPESQINHLGEGWFQVRVTMTPQGKVVEPWLEDALGSQLLYESAIKAIARARYAPPTSGGKPVTYYTQMTFEFRISGDNRAGVHRRFETNYDRARQLREQKRYVEALAALNDNNNLTMNLYEHAVTSYGLAMTYLGLGDWRRALRHLRHATIEKSIHLDKAQRLSALSQRAELEAQDGKFEAALCAANLMRETYPDAKLSARLDAALAAAREGLSSRQPLRTEVEIVESLRSEIEPHWSHPITRAAFRIEHGTKRLHRYRLVCATSETQGALPASGVINSGRGPCRLFVYGEPGAQFVLHQG